MNAVPRNDYNQAMTLLGLDHTDRDLHLISAELAEGRIVANFTSVTKIGTPDGAAKALPVYRKNTDPDAPAPGLYRVHWKTGGTSLAAVGHDHSGRLWLAATNWVITPASFGRCFDWFGVDRVERIDPDHNATVQVGSIADEFAERKR